MVKRATSQIPKTGRSGYSREQMLHPSKIEKPELVETLDSLCGRWALENSLRTDARCDLGVGECGQEASQICERYRARLAVVRLANPSKKFAATSAVVDGRFAP